MSGQVNFQRRHYEFIACCLRMSEAPEHVIREFADALKFTNYLFNREKFIAAATTTE